MRKEKLDVKTSGSNVLRFQTTVIPEGTTESYTWDKNAFKDIIYSMSV